MPNRRARLSTPAAVPGTAMLYTRVSTDEQAERGFSLREQEASLRAFCQKQGLRVVGHYQDDASAKTFSRPAWARLIADAASVRPSVVLFTKWDRFSRDTTDALSMIRVLQSMGIEPRAAEQPIDWAIPEQKFLLSIYLTSPHVENERRSLNTRAGLRRAQEEGRWTTTPPYGYRGERDRQGKTVLVSNDEGGERGPASRVREAFRLAATTDWAMEDIRRTSGVKVSKNQFTLLLRNVVYAGKVRVTSGDGQVVDGQHDALIDEATFARVQARFGDAPKPSRRVAPEAFPLRRSLLCLACGQPLTASNSKGRDGYYAYYHCAKGLAGQGHARFRAEAVHAAFEQNLRRVTVGREVRALFAAVLDDVASEENAKREAHIRRLRDTLERAEARSIAAADRLVAGDLSPEAYARVAATYEAQIDAARQDLARAEEAGTDSDVVRYALRLFADLAGVWTRSSVEGRAHLLGSIWPESLTFDGVGFGTTFDTPVIALFRGKRAENDGRPTLVEGRRPIGLPG